MTGGNHTWDKKEIIPLFATHELLRPHNYPEEVDGVGCKIYNIAGEDLAIINLMGHYSMPHTDNVFKCAIQTVDDLKRVDDIKNIFIDFHAEASSEKRALMKMLEGNVSAIIGTHTHISSDDFHISKSTAYMSDIGLSGCRDNIIGMDSKVPIKQFLTGIKGHFDIPNNCKKILQIAIMDISQGKCTSAYKIKQFCNGSVIKTEAWIEED
jgi:metallophosphoesterase (TIGR00282 family)